MTTIDKTLPIKNKKKLEALNKLIPSSTAKSKIVELTNEQKIMLGMSEDDIRNGKLISQVAMGRRNLEWLDPM